MKFILGYLRSLVAPEFASTAIKVALVVGTVLLMINHGTAIYHRAMTADRWLGVLITYIVPYLVNVHGQYSSHHRRRSG
jgi:hypothetical protein